MFIEAVIAALAVALLSVLGVFFFGSRGHLTGTHRFIIPLAIGVFLGVVFFELIPETLALGGEAGSLPIALGFVGFFLLSQLLRTYHHHHDHGSDDDGCEDRTGASLLLIGDSVHNLADGIVIASAFLINPAVGVATAIGVALHEIPQEIVEFAILLKAGFSKSKAAFYNLLSASSVVFGVILTLLFAQTFDGYIWILTGLAAGNLLYIAASDLLPDLQEVSRQHGSTWQPFVAMLIGLLGIMFLLDITHSFLPESDHEHEEHTEMVG